MWPHGNCPTACFRYFQGLIVAVDLRFHIVECTGRGEGKLGGLLASAFARRMAVTLNSLLPGTNLGPVRTVRCQGRGRGF